MRSRQETILLTAAIPQLVPAEIFDAFAWNRSTSLTWVSSSPLDLATPLTADNPPGMVFLLDASCTFLPRELAYLHVPQLVASDESESTWALAPYAIDDATDHLYEQRVEPRTILRLATSSLTGLFWGLHDWAHFHNHGAFDEDQRALTELQCDTAALVWIRSNLSRIGIDRENWLALRRDVQTVARARFVELPPRAHAGLDLLSISTNVERYLDGVDSASL